MNARTYNLFGWLLGAGLALLLCTIAVVSSQYSGDSSRDIVLYFDELAYFPLIVLAIAFVVASKLRRSGDRIEGEQVLRHDGIARITHWTTAFGCLLLMATGVALGFLFVPRMVTDASATAVLFNLHFVGALFFLFGSCLWAANQIVDRKRMQTHLPDESLVQEIKKSVLHYTHMAGLTKKHIEAPKYHHSGRLAGLIIIATSLVIILSGFAKLAVRGIDVSPTIATIINLSHDGATLVMLMLIPVHAFLGGVAPWAWNTLKGMFTGYVSRDYAKQHHTLWFKELEAKQRQEKK
ncbi:cytochrome b/b6 domain-containing protein [Shewanella abyssi]|uniref:cytochrome b/b6 domain-containing protein n=1 Tax=Shewanella abyssi TaxID=311789 RepID=UPI00200D6416|nr:cytochrome b/b6 domain-containing protein [Shewanella abyssi]MCL1050650.1 cytochrome b/b6 domain-containing protein [Shewanella abyssi]